MARAAVVVALGTLVAAPATGQSPCWRITDLGTIDDKHSYAADINDFGRVVGWLAPLRFNAFQWLGGQMIKLAEGHSHVYGINDSGWIAGSEGWPGKPTVWVDGKLKRLPKAWQFSGIGNKINTAGDVAGHIYDPDPGEDAAAVVWLWSGDKWAAPQSIGPNYSIAYDINDARQVVGYQKIGSRRRNDAWGFDAETKRKRWLEKLPEAGDRHSLAYAINAYGQIAGYAQASDGAYHAVMWDFDTGAIHDLGTFGGVGAYAQDIDDAGRVVGCVSMPDKSVWPFLYDGGGWVNLSEMIPPGSGWRNLVPTAINNVGQIVGHGSINGKVRGFLLERPSETTAALQYAGCTDPANKGWTERGGKQHVKAYGVCSEPAWVVEDENALPGSTLFYEKLVTPEQLYRATAEGWALRARLNTGSIRDPSGSITVSFHDGDRTFTMLFGGDRQRARRSCFSRRT